MYKFLLSLLILLSSTTVFSQSDLSSLYSIEQLEELQKTNPEVLRYWNTYLERGWVLDKIKSGEELSNVIALPENEAFNKETFNPLDHKIYPSLGIQYIGIEGSELVLIVYPKSHVIYHFNKKNQ